MKQDQNKRIIEEERKEAFTEYVKSTNELRKDIKKKTLFVVIILVFAITIIKIFFGTIELYNIFGYPPSNARYYNVTVNKKQVAVSYISTQIIPIIPYVVNFNSVYMGNSRINNDDTGNLFYADNSEEYIMEINSYNCYHKNIQVECENNQQEMKKNDDEKYSTVTITRITNPREVVYQGKYINDIFPYTTEKGQYHIEITAKRGLVETKMYFIFENL